MKPELKRCCELSYFLLENLQKSFSNTYVFITMLGHCQIHLKLVLLVGEMFDNVKFERWHLKNW